MMNKRQKEKLKKRQELLKLQWENGQKVLKNDKRQERRGYNIEGYKDPTAEKAIENVTRRGY